MITMDEEVQLIDGRTYAPIRFIAQALGLNVSFDNGNAIFTRQVNPYSNKFTKKVLGLISKDFFRGKENGERGKKMKYLTT